MTLTGKTIGFAMTGSFCTLERSLLAMAGLVSSGARVVPIVSNSVATESTRFGTPVEWIRRIREIAGRPPLASLSDVEPIGPQRLLDLLVVAPCTGSTLSRVANAQSDTPVTLAVKAQLRNGRPVVLAISTNDGLGLNARNLGVLLSVRNMFFVPFGQDNPQVKPNSLDARLELLVLTIEAALEGKQLQPLLVAVQ